MVIFLAISKNLQAKVSSDFYEEFRKAADDHNVSVSMFASFGLSLFLASFKESDQLKLLMQKNVEEIIKNLDEK